MFSGTTSEITLLWHAETNFVVSIMIDVHSLTFCSQRDMVKTGGENMRITKEPEERKQEILDVAIRLFNEKGYEKTSIGDIAKTMGVAQGLCYRYFPSKEALFDSAVEQYAHLLVDTLSLPVGVENMPLKQIIEQMPTTVETGHSEYYQVFHEAKNKKFHDQLTLKVCEILVPIVENLLDKASVMGEIHIPNIETAALFCVYGQLGILLDKRLSAEEKNKQIREFLIYALRL